MFCLNNNIDCLLVEKSTICWLNINYMLIETYIICWLKHILLFGCCDRHQLDQTSTLGGRKLVKISTKLRPPQCRNFYQTSTPPVSKFGRWLLGIAMTYIINLIKCLPNCDTKLQPNFDQTWGVEVWSEFRPNFDTGGSKFGRNFDQTSTPTRSTYTMC